jgi:hypothetical protein
MKKNGGVVQTVAFSSYQVDAPERTAAAGVQEDSVVAAVGCGL